MNGNKSAKVLISGYYGFNNFGDEAVLTVLINSLRQEHVNDITVISKDPKGTRKTHGTKTVYTFNLLKIFFEILRTDVLFSGGGSLLQDVTSAKSLLYYLSLIILSLFFGKKVIIFAQGIGPLKNNFLKKLTKFVLKKCSFVTVRDKRSYDLLKSWDIPAELVCDPVWKFKTSKMYSHNGVGVQLRSWHLLTDEMIKSLAKAISENFPQKKIFIFALQRTQDKEVCEKLEEEILKINPKIYTQVILNRKPSSVSDSFSHLDMMIAMRYHACLLALKYGIKTLPVIYDPKVEILADEFGLSNRIYLYNTEEIVNAVKRFNSDNYKQADKPLPDFDFSVYTKFLK